MCLIKQHWLPRFSFKDKVVYKMIIACNNNNYYTPYERIKINLGRVLYAKRHWFFTLFKTIIEGEGVHAYCNEKTALWQSKIFDDDTIVIKCVIPKFTFYWLGYDSEIASTKLLITNKYRSM